MDPYIELVRQDVSYHEEASSWPFSVSQLVQFLQNKLRLPRWLKSGPVPYTNECVLELLHQLRVSDDAFQDGIWDDTESVNDDDFRRLHAVFDTALADCARIQAVLETERATGTPFPKASFLSILVRNAVLNVNPELSMLDDVLVVLPRHFSGRPIPILKYMSKSFLVPLVISLCEEMPVEEDVSDPEHRPSDDGGSNSPDSSVHPFTMSEFLDWCEETIIHEEDEEEEEGPLPPQFEAHFLASRSSTTAPSVCHIPALCMTDEEQLPVLMSSLLYQRRVWHINDPLVGIRFSKYDTVIKLYVGWLEDSSPSDRVLPRVHLGEIESPRALDLSSPLIALAVSRLLCGLEPHISGIRDTIKRSACGVVSGARCHSSLSWRIDTEIPQQNQGPDPSRDVIMQWAEYQQYSECEECVVSYDHYSLTHDATKHKVDGPRKECGYEHRIWFRNIKAIISTIDICENIEYGIFAKLIEGGEPVDSVREPHGETDSITTLLSPFTCSAFAATSEKDDHRVFRWMFDRRVVPQSIPSDITFREEYKEMTGFIWPETWHTRNDLPLVDAALEPYVHELVENVAKLEHRPDAVKRIPSGAFPVDLRVLERSFSAIFQACHRSREKTELPKSVNEASWRVDHDRLLFDFFIRLIETPEDEATRSLTDQSDVRLEDPLARPTLETTLRLPRSDFLKYTFGHDLEESFIELLSRRSNDLSSWVLKCGGTPTQVVEEGENNTYAASQWYTWRRAVKREQEAVTISMLRLLPVTGRCDALGRLLVELPNVSSDGIYNFQLVRAAKKTPLGETTKDKNSTKKYNARTNFGVDKLSTKKSKDSLTALDVPTDAAEMMDGTRYNIPSSSISSSSPLVEEQVASTDSMNALASRVRKLQIGSSNAYLELPILAAEYKKVSDNSMKGTNQLRMYLTASVKFLQALGITNIPVYGVQTDGPIVVLPAAILRDDDFVYMFERLVERLDISTAVGAWHYATILCRLAHNHGKVLERKFKEVKEDLLERLRGEGKQGAEEWTIVHQMAKLTEERAGKSPNAEKVK